MISDSLNIAASSLKTQQRALDVVSHNIANVNTPGYSRQSADLATLSSEKIAGLNLGRGVDIVNVRRLVDPIINQAILNNGSQLSYWDTTQKGLQAVENVFGSLQSTGLAAALDGFFTSWKQLANNPQDNGQKVNVRAKSSALIDNLNNMSQQIRSEQTNTDANINQSITRANQILDNIASLTTQIQRSEAGNKGIVGQANDLRDQRDQAVRDLAKIIPVQEVQTSGGSLMLQTLNGDLLVQDNTARHLARGSGGTGNFANIVIQGSNTTIDNALQGGVIGGMINLRDNKLSSYIQQMDSIAANLVFSVNQVHASGASTKHATALTAGQSSNAALALNDATQTAPFAAQIKSGSFKLHVYDNTGTPTPAGGATISVTAGVTTMNDIATAINAITGVSASVNASGQLNITAATGNTFSLSSDSSNMLAAYEINSFFQGNNAGSIALASAIQSDAGAINTGQVDPATSTINLGDNSAALAILGLQNAALSVDGTTTASLHDRTTSISTQYGTDTAASVQQKDYRSVESDSLKNQRQAVSGVNVDEELVSMIKFQRAYESSAKVITTTNQMLDSLMGLIR